MVRKTENLPKAIFFILRPSFLLILFSLLNFLLAHGPWGLETKLWIGLIGFGFPFLLVWNRDAAVLARDLSFPQKEILPAFSTPIFLCVFLLAALIRFFWIWTHTPWLIWDDSQQNFYAIALSEHWNWKFFFGPEKHFPIYTWLQGLFFKVIEPSLSSFRFFIFLASLIPLPVAFLALKAHFSRTLLLLYSCLLAFCFWPIFLGRFPTDVGLEILGQYLCWGIFLALLSSVHGKNTHTVLWSGVLGFSIGAAWYLSKFWIPNIPFFLGLGILALFRLRRNAFRPGLALIGGFLIAVLPMVYELISQRYGAHLRLILSSAYSQSWTEQVRIFFFYVSALFWGMPSMSYFTFGPSWGGLLNPVAGAGFFLGVMELVKERREKLGLLALGAFLVLFVPGTLTSHVEMMRIVGILPLALGLIAWGWWRVLAEIHTRHRFPAFLLILGFSLALDLFHLFGPFQDWCKPGDTHGIIFQERYAAFQILQKVTRQRGPGLVFFNFVPEVYDQSLLTATYPFNAERNPRLSWSQAEWMGCLTRSCYRDYLSRRFPGGSAYSLPSSYDPNDLFNRDFILFVAPISVEQKAALEVWREADRFLSRLYQEIPYHLAPPDSVNLAQKMVREVKDEEQVFKSDKYLESVYWWKRLLYAEWDPRSKELQDIVDVLGLSAYPGHFWDPLRGAAYHSLGDCQVKEKSYFQAIRSYQEAGRWDATLVPPPVAVELLTRLAKDRLNP